MTLIPLASRGPAAVREALVRRGMEQGRAAEVAQGLSPVVLILDGLDPPTRDLVADAARSLNVERLTGDDWVLLSGSAAQLGGLARAGWETIPLPTLGVLGDYLRGSVEPAEVWETARGTIRLDRPVVVGILNLTPDSFSDGGRFVEPQAALRQAATMIGEGADMLDIGAESTRPGGAEPVSPAEEWRRLQPVLEELVLRHPDVPISVDTVKAETAAKALEVGASVVNDVSGLRLEPGIAGICAHYGAGLLLMHSRGPLGQMAGYEAAQYRDVVAEVREELTAAVQRAEEGGVARRQLVVDPGLGFSKTPAQSYEVLRGLPAVRSIGLPVLVGPSRKRFLGAVTGRAVSERDLATAAACVAAFALGATLFRVHAVAPVREALDVAAAVGRA